MASAAVPSSKQKMSPAIKWTAIGAAVVVAYTFLSGGDAPAPAAAAKKKTKSAKDAGNYTAEDMSAKFAMVTAKPSDVFNPLIKKQAPVIQAKIGPNQGLAGALTGGEAGWFYTGMVELDGTRQALLENTVSGESVYVSAGETWKAAHVASVDISTLVLVGPDGTKVEVPITQYGAAPGAVASTVTPGAAAGTQPMAPMRGPIGAANPANIGVRPVAGMATMTMPDGSTMQVPFDQSALNNNGNNQGGGRRGRRNRNNNINNAPQGDY